MGEPEGLAITVASVDDVDDGATFLQRRLSRMVAVMTTIAWVALPAHVVSTYFLSTRVPAHLTLITFCFSMFAVGGTALFWSVRPGHRRSTRQLHAIETSAVLATIALMASIMVVGTGRIEDVDVGGTCAGFVVLGRSLIVPSSWRRTLWLSVTAMAIPLGALITIAITAPERSALPLPQFLGNGLFLCGIPVFLATTSSQVISGLREQVRSARRLGQYTLGEKIGEGGMGTVYKARHALLRRPTAIKILRADRNSDDAIRRFEREVQITAGLTDPHIVSIFDYGRSADGTFYYAMEYLDGIDLERLVREFGPQPAGRVVAIIGQICDALAEAHGSNLIHRDIKPANIVLCERGLRSDAVKVLDFGLVHRVDANITGIAGTPGYLSPEAIDDPSKVAAASDLYAVGAVAYFLLTGTAVFDAKTFAEICDHHLHSSPAAPSSRTDRPIPAALDAIVLACLEKSPAARPTSAITLRVALNALDIPAWTAVDADAWWSAFRARPLRVTAPIDPVAQTVAVAER